MRQYQGGGRRGPWDGVADERFRPFERSDGTVMTQEEITRVTNGLPRRAPISDEVLEQLWVLVADVGQAAAARQLGLTQAGVQYRLEAYMKRKGLTGELPGKQVKPAAEPKIAKVPASKLDGDKPTEAQLQARSRAAELLAKPSPPSDRHVDEPATPEIVVPPARSQLGGDGPSMPDEIRPFTHFLHGDEEWPARPIASPESAALTPLMDWLEQHGPDWNDSDAERWLKAFTATIDLVYPTRAAA